MTATTYDDGWTLRDARTAYFRDNAFGDDGGYAKKWVAVQLGPVSFAFPNTAARVRAVKYHDLHHVVTGYATDVVGEAEIGAWEIGSGCAGFVAAWVLNLYAMMLGFLAGAPRAVWRAFVRGRHTRNLYRTAYDDALLETKLGELRARLALEAGAVDATFGDRFAFAAWAAVSTALSLATVGLALAPFVWIVRAVT